MERGVLGTIGSPLVQVQSPPGSVVAAKVESKNPGGSAKDRPALAMVEAAERALKTERSLHLHYGERLGYGPEETVVENGSDGHALEVANATNVTIRSLAVEGGLAVTGDSSAVSLTSLTVEDELSVGGATVTSTDIKASNGVIHVIDGVLLPSK